MGPSTSAEDESHLQKTPSRCRASGHCRWENPLQPSADEVIERAEPVYNDQRARHGWKPHCANKRIRVLKCLNTDTSVMLFAFFSLSPSVVSILIPIIMCTLVTTPSEQIRRNVMSWGLISIRECFSCCGIELGSPKDAVYLLPR